MGKKFSFNKFFNLYVFLYLIVLSNNISYAIELGIINNNIFLYFAPRNHFGIYESIFMISTIFFTLTMMCQEIDNIYIYDDEERKRKVKIKLIPYKIFVIITIAFSSYTMYFGRYKDLMLSSVVLIAFSIYMHFIKSCYIKSYIYDKKLEWDNKCKYGDEDKSIPKDTTSWRYKIWFNGLEKIKFKYRIEFLSSYFTTYVFIVLIILNQDSKIKMITSLIISIVICGRSLLDSIFGLFTSIEGKCSGILEERGRNNTIKYKICVTDYNNKREIMINTYDRYGLEEMDNVYVVHGVFSKKAVSINNIYIRRNVFSSTFISAILILFVVIPSARINIENINYRNKQEEYEYIKNQNDIYEGKVEPQKRPIINNTDYKKVIDINKSETHNYGDGEEVIITADKLFLSKSSSKLVVKIENNTKAGLVLNALDVIKIYDKSNSENSNILLPGESYICDVNINDIWDEKKTSYLNIDLEYTLSESIMFDNQYMDYNGYIHYDLNVIDNNCSIDIDLKDENINILYEVYDTFYSVSDIVAKFK